MIDDDLMQLALIAANEEFPDDCNLEYVLRDEIGLADREHCDYIDNLRHHGLAAPERSPNVYEYVDLTKEGRDVANGDGWIAFIEKLRKDERRAEKDTNNKSRLLDWQVTTFWPLFAISLLGSVYAGYDFFMSDPSTEQEIQELWQAIGEMESEQSTSRTSPSGQKREVPSSTTSSVGGNLNKSLPDSVISKQSSPSDSIKFNN